MVACVVCYTLRECVVVEESRSKTPGPDLVNLGGTNASQLFLAFWSQPDGPDQAPRQPPFAHLSSAPTSQAPWRRHRCCRLHAHSRPRPSIAASRLCAPSPRTSTPQTRRFSLPLPGGQSLVGDPALQAGGHSSRCRRRSHPPSDHPLTRAPTTRSPGRSAQHARHSRGCAHSMGGQPLASVRPRSTARRRPLASVRPLSTAHSRHSRRARACRHRPSRSRTARRPSPPRRRPPRRCQRLCLRAS